jgi:hypothetical protein
VAGDGIDRLDLAPVALAGARVEQQRRLQLADLDRVTLPYAHPEVAGRLTHRAGLGRAAGRAPGAQAAVEHGHVLVAEVPQQPPEPRGAALARPVVRDHARVVAHARAPGSRLERRRLRQRVAAALARLPGQVAIHVEEGRTGDVAFEPEALAGARLAELEAAVDHAQVRLAEPLHELLRPDQRCAHRARTFTQPPSSSSRFRSRTA